MECSEPDLTEACMFEVCMFEFCDLWPTPVGKQEFQRLEHYKYRCVYTLSVPEVLYEECRLKTTVLD